MVLGLCGQSSHIFFVDGVSSDSCAIRLCPLFVCGSSKCSSKRPSHQIVISSSQLKALYIASKSSSSSIYLLVPLYKYPHSRSDNWGSLSLKVDYHLFLHQVCMLKLLMNIVPNLCNVLTLLPGVDHFHQILVRRSSRGLWAICTS